MNPICRRLPAFAAIAMAVAAVTAALAPTWAVAQTSPPAATATAAAAAGEERVIYHVNDMASAREALVNVSNHLAASPKARIALLANGRGIFTLVKGEKDRVGEYATLIAELQAKGVKFTACRNSMTLRNVEPAALAPGVAIVQAGVVELARLQGQEQYAYIKP